MNRSIWYNLCRLGFAVIGGICATIFVKRILYALGRTQMRITLGQSGAARMPFDFDQTKTAQAVAFLLKRSPRQRESYMKILKELYIADRESIKETGRPITGDAFVAMKKGPVLSQVYDLIKGVHAGSAEWNHFIQKRMWDIELIEDPGIGKLCRYEMDKLAEVAERYKRHGKWRVVDLTHDFPEWKKNDPGNSMKPIPLSDVLEAINASDRQVLIESDAAERRAFHHLFRD